MIGAHLREAAALRRERWESLCNRCGRCCYEKRVVGSRVITDWHRPCPHLEVKTGLCRVYDRRFELCGSCRRMTLAHALFTRWLPADCGYVQHYRRRQGGPVPGRPVARRGEKESPHAIVR